MTKSSAPPIIATLDRALAERWPPCLTSGDVEPLLARAVHAQRLAECSRALLALPVDRLDESGRTAARSAVNACEAIRAETIAEQRRIENRWSTEGIATEMVEPASPAKMQFHSFECVIDTVDLDAALAVAAADGFHRWAPSGGGGWESFRRTHCAVTLVRADAVTTRLILRWAPKPRKHRVRDWLRPTTLDYQLFDLPKDLWPLYHVVRPARVAFDRLVRGRRRRAAWPYLGTPSGLVEPLLDLAGVTEDDRIVDLGCGDGRILISAARSRGCRGHGIEQDPTYAGLARERAAAASVDGRVRIETGDAARADVGDASVVFLFLPPDAVAKLLPTLHRRLHAGARILSHEQLPLADALTPAKSKPLFAANALTVAHLWTVG